MKFQKYLMPAVFIIVALFLFFISNNRNRNSSSTELTAPSWHNIRKDRLQSLQIQSAINPNLKYTLTKEKGEWFLSDPMSVPTFPEKSLLLINSFLNLRISQILSNLSEQEFIDYGLMNPRLEVIGTLNNESNIGFILGGSILDGTQFYIAELNNTNTAYIIDAEDVEPYIQGIAHIINDHILMIPSDHISGFEFKNISNMILSFTNINRSWQDKENLPVDWGLKRFILDLKSVRFDPELILFDPSPSQLEEFGINQETNPYIILFEENKKIEIYVGITRDRSTALYLPQRSMLVWVNRTELNNLLVYLKEDFYVQP